MGIDFLGKSKKNEGVGFKLPPESVLQEISCNITNSGGNIYVIPSFSNDNVRYTIDMDLGICDCEVGSDGSPCKHQYLLWTTHKSGNSNFLPYLSAEERKMYSYLAIGETLPDVYYEGLHDHFTQESDEQDRNKLVNIFCYF